ncbi:MAG: hypothetical protein D6732_22410 [Methanobacteriota archaeon]|nr:MAG: hypothetical protein D6732_22410 [Euryarchaeota archaeon]
MRFKIDENLPVEVADVLQAKAFEALTVYEQNLSGVNDANLAQICRNEKRILITLDMDFADIRSYPPEEYYGFMVLRVKRQDKLYIMKIISEVVEVLLHESPIGQLWIIEEGKIRVRGKDQTE